MPASVSDAPAGDAEQLLLAALAEHYGPAEFSARAAAADLDAAFWAAVGVARPDAGSCGRWLRARKGVVAGYVLANRKNRDGVSLWRLRPAEPRQPAPAGDAARPCDPASLLPLGTTPTASLPAPEARPWWSIAAAPFPPAGGVAERQRGASWWADLGEVVP